MAQNPYQKARYNAQRRIKRAVEKGYQIPEQMRNIPSYSELKTQGYSSEQISELTEQLNLERLYNFDEIGKVFRSDTGEVILTSEQEETFDRERYRDLFGTSGYYDTDSYYVDLADAQERYRAEQHAIHMELFDQVEEIIERFEKEFSWLRYDSGGRGNGYFVDWRRDKAVLKSIWEETRTLAKNRNTEKSLFDYITANINAISQEVSNLIESRYSEEYKGTLANIAVILKGGASLTQEEAEELALELDTINGW